MLQLRNPGRCPGLSCVRLSASTSEFGLSLETPYLALTETYFALESACLTLEKACLALERAYFA